MKINTLNLPLAPKKRSLYSSTSMSFFTAEDAVINPKFLKFWQDLTHDERDGILTIIFRFNLNYLGIKIPERENRRIHLWSIPGRHTIQTSGDSGNIYFAVVHLSPIILELVHYITSWPTWPLDINNITDDHLSALTVGIYLRSKTEKKSLINKINLFKKLIETHLLEIGKTWQYGNLLPASSRVLFLTE